MVTEKSRVAALVALADAGIPVDVQELLLKNSALDKALEAALSTDAEPVGYFVSGGGTSGEPTFFFHHEKNEDYWRDRSFTVVPLYASPPAPSVAVKALEPFVNKANWLRAGHRPEVPGPTEIVWAFSENGYTTDGEPWERICSALSAQVQDVAEVSPSDYMRRHDAAIAAYEASTPSDYRYSAAALRKAVDAAFAVAAAPAAKLEGKP